MSNQSHQWTPKSKLVNVVGLVAAVVGILFAVVTLETVLTKILGFLSCVMVAILMLEAAHDRERGHLSNAMLWKLSSTGVLLLVLIVALANGGKETQDGAQETGTQIIPAPGAEVNSSSPPTSGPSTTGGVVPTSVGGVAKKPTYLVDLTPIPDSQSDQWVTKPVQIKNRQYDKALSVQEPWCDWTALDYLLSGKYSTFQATVGIDANSSNPGSLDFIVIADEKVAKKVSGVTYASPQSIEVPIGAVTRLSIRMESTSFDDECPGLETVGAWVDARVS